MNLEMILIFWRYDADEINDLEPYFKNIIDIVDKQMYYIEPNVSYNLYRSKETDEFDEKYTKIVLIPGGDASIDIFRTICINEKQSSASFNISNDEIDYTQYELVYSENLKFIDDL